MAQRVIDRRSTEILPTLPGASRSVVTGGGSLCWHAMPWLSKTSPGAGSCRQHLWSPILLPALHRVPPLSLNRGAGPPCPRPSHSTDIQSARTPMAYPAKTACANRHRRRVLRPMQEISIAWILSSSPPLFTASGQTRAKRARRTSSTSSSSGGKCREKVKRDKAVHDVHVQRAKSACRKVQARYTASRETGRRRHRAAAGVDAG